VFVFLLKKKNKITGGQTLACGGRGRNITRETGLRMYNRRFCFFCTAQKWGKFVFFLLLLFSYSLTAQDNIPGHLLITLKANARAWPTGRVQQIADKMPDQTRSLFKKYGVARVERWLKSADAGDVYNGVAFNKIYRIYLGKPSFLLAAQKDFLQLSSVRHAAPEPVVKIAGPIPATTPDDPYFERQWYLKRIMANFAWTLSSEIPTDTDPVLIGIVDTGIDYLHPDIGAALYVNPGEDLNGDGQASEEDYNGIDDDGNGFVDDLLGWDFSQATDSLPGDNDIRPPVAGAHEILSHGTHVAGIAAAIHDNEVGISGIARHYRIIGTKHSRDDDVNHGYLYNAYDGILYAAKLGAKVINCSWGGEGYYQEAQDLIDMVTEKYGAIVVAAAGNDNSNNDSHHFYPSDLNHVVTVAALGAGDQRAYFSNYGHVIDISAPGQGIYSTIHYSAGGYASWQGTSMASPVVTGSLALIKAFFPDLPREEVIGLLLDAADPIDAKNPGYQGLLGAGRVNVYQAIAPRFLPGLKIVRDSIEWDDANGNAQIDPGETVRISLHLENGANWQDAHQVTVTAHVDDSLVVIQDSVLHLGEVPAGTCVDTEAQDFVFSIQPSHSYGRFSIRFDVTCNPDSSLPYDEAYTVDLLLSTYQKGFPKDHLGSLLPVSLFRSEKEKKNFIVFISSDKKLNLLDSQGEVVSPFPLSLEEYHRIPPLMADLNNDGESEIMTVSQRGKIKVFTVQGDTLWTRDLAETVYGNVAVADVDGDSLPEIVLGTMNKKLHVLNERGREQAGFPVNVGSFVEKGVALGDVDGDGRSEMVFGTFDRKLHCFNEQGSEEAGWPVELASRARFTPVIAQDTQGRHIFITDRDNHALLFNGKGQVELDTTLAVPFVVQPAFGDVNGDGVAEALTLDEEGRMWSFSTNGKVWKIEMNSADKNAVPLSVLNARQEVRLITASNTGTVCITDGTGHALPFAPIQLDRPVATPLTIGDLDNDGDLEVLGANSESLFAVDLPDSLDTAGGWTTFMGNNQRTGFYRAAPATAIREKAPAQLPAKMRITVFPNPFNLGTQVRVHLPASLLGSPLRATVYDIRGRKVATLFNGKVSQTNYRWYWRAKNLQGKIVSSGIYFIMISVQNRLFGKQVLLIK